MTLSFGRTSDAASWLFEQHKAKQKFVAIPQSIFSGTLSEAYDVQDQLVKLLEPQSGTIVGYKIGLTTPRMQQLCGIDQPIAGAVLARNAHQSPATVRISDYVHLGIESELAMQILSPLSGEVPVSEVPKYVSKIAAAFELIEDRAADYRTLDILTLVADNSWNAGIVLGSQHSVIDIAELDGVLQIDGMPTDRGSSRDVLGHPYAAVAWLSRHLGARGRSLQPGQWIMTGSIVTTKFAKSGEQYVFSLGQLKPVELVVSM